MTNSSNEPMRRRNSAGTSAKAPESKLPGWIDWLVLAVAAGISIFSILVTSQTGALSVQLTGDSNWAWHLVRICGLVSYTLMAASTLWGVFLSSRVIKDWSPGPLSLLMHATTSWLALILAIAHVAFLMFDTYYQYKISDLIIPFVGPYRPIATGLGVIALWLTVAITVSFSMRKLIGQKAWKWLHYTSYGAFGLVTVHALFAGTDASGPGLQIVLAAFALGLIVLVVGRIAQITKRNSARA